MSNKLKIIMDEVISIQAGLLRFRHREKQQNLQVRIALGGDNSLHCLITGQVPVNVKISGKKVHLIQRHNDDYFFISGYIVSEAPPDSRVLSIGIVKASWFVMKRRGSVSWLREKYSYENAMQRRAVA
jgi:hypothetical protein